MLTTAAPRPAPGTRTRPAPSPPRQAPPLRVVSAPNQAEARRRARGRRLLAALAGLVALLLFGVVVAHVLLMQGQFELERLQQTSAEEQATYDRLRLRVAELESPDLVVQVAQERLGMVVPATIRYLAPSVDAVAAGSSPPAAGASSEAGEVVAASAGDSASWSTVKPHLGDG